jgi:hypothetical protein
LTFFGTLRWWIGTVASQWVHRRRHSSATTRAAAQAIHETFQLVGDTRTKRHFEVR